MEQILALSWAITVPTEALGTAGDNPTQKMWMFVCQPGSVVPVSSGLSSLRPSLDS